ncbi:MAG: B12-binding domain-containing radical SAM protein [Nitrospirota bacterium]
MRLRILLINPWICDFAAYNLWARPLGLLKVAEFLSSFDAELMFIDCTDSFKARQYGTGKFRSEPIEKPELLKGIPRLYKRYGISDEEFQEQVWAAQPVDIVLITSVMSYWYPGVQSVIERLRAMLGDVPVILGGIYPTLYPEHAARHSGADFIFKGPINAGLTFALSTFGFKLKRKRAPLHYYELDLYRSYPFAPLLTSTGCPFHCSYCASHLLYDHYSRRPPIEVLHEVRALYALGVRDYAFYDDALLIDAELHIKPVLRLIIGEGLNVRFHTPNGLHARYVDEELAWLLRKSNFRTLRLSIETVNSERQKSTGGKVASVDIKHAVMQLKKQGFTKKELGAYLMYGLPGQDIEEVREGVAFLKSLGIRINLTEFSPLRGTGCWDELVEQGIIDDDLDPLLTNNTVFSALYAGYDPGAIATLKLDVQRYNAS